MGEAFKRNEIRNLAQTTKRINRLEHLGVDRKIILKWTVKIQGTVV
jgi:hypothetical protein